MSPRVRLRGPTGIGHERNEKGVKGTLVFRPTVTLEGRTPLDAGLRLTKYGLASSSRT